MSSNVELKLDWCSYRAAKFAVERWHYSQRMPLFKQVFIGVWENGIFIGVVIFGLSVTPYLGNVFGLKNIECAELTRIALKSHNATVSKIGAIALKFITKQSPGLRLIVSYADPFQGHYGVIYQAMNWIYIGKSKKVKQYYWRRQWRNDTSMFRAFKINPELKNVTESRIVPEKFKFLYPLDREMRRQILSLAKPYPKCLTSKDSVALSDQDKEGGSIPTVRL